MQSRFQVKIRTNDSIRRYSFPEAPTWESFKSHVISQIIHTCNLQPDNIILRLEYIDDENDTVTISSEEEWKEMLNQKHNTTLVTLFLRGWETIPKEGEVPVRPAAENIEELNRREEEALQEIRRIMELQTENKRKEEERKFQELKRLEAEELIRLAEEELVRFQEHKHKEEEERKLLEELKKEEEEQQRKLLEEQKK